MEVPGGFHGEALGGGGGGLRPSLVGLDGLVESGGCSLVPTRWLHDSYNHRLYHGRIEV